MIPRCSYICYYNERRILVISLLVNWYFMCMHVFILSSLSFRFHLLDEFDDAKKSCRKRLADHNRRRRKSKPSDGDAGDKKRAHANKAAAAKDSTWYTLSIPGLLSFNFLRLNTQGVWLIVHYNMHIIIDLYICILFISIDNYSK